MTRTAQAAARNAEIDGLKRLITSVRFESLETLEAAVDSYLWSNYDRQQTEPVAAPRDVVRTRPK